MKTAWVTKMILWVMRFISGLEKEDWDKTLEWVKEAETTLNTGKEKGQWVNEQAKSAFKHLAPYAIEAVIGLAVGFLAKKGDIHVNIPEA